MQPEEKKKPSAGSYVGFGCSVLALLGVLGAVAGWLLLSNKFQEVSDDMNDPAARTAKVKKTLGAAELPAGYHAVMTLSVPLVMDTAVLSTRRLDVPQGLQKGDGRFFIYMHLKSSSGADLETLRAYLEGRSEDASVLAGNNIHLRTRDIIGRGTLQLEGWRLLYLLHRGVMDTSTSGQKSGPGLNSLSLIECPGQTHIRIGLWMSPDPSPRTSLDKLELKDTPVDADALKAFMSHFNPCQQES
jgi:hypothetical protein